MKTKRRKPYLLANDVENPDLTCDDSDDQQIEYEETNHTNNNGAKLGNRVVSIIHSIFTISLFVGFLYERNKRLELEYITYNLKMDSISSLRELDISRSLLDTKEPCPGCPICIKTECPTCTCPQCPLCATCQICSTPDPTETPTSMPTSVSPTSAPTFLPTPSYASTAATLSLYKQSRELLIMEVQRLSRAILQHTFGSEPYKVAMSVKLPSSESAAVVGTITPSVVVFEMAPSTHMPYTVLYFLSQVQAGLWNGCEFMRNAGHVLQASNVGESCAAAMFKGSTARGEGLVFQEYWEGFPHSTHSVGIAGRPGGPDFYINLEDNRLIHGSGGQGVEEGQLPNEADPCFAKVVSGFEVVGKMHSLPVKPGNYASLVNNVQILEMKVLSTVRASLVADMEATMMNIENVPSVPKSAPDPIATAAVISNAENSKASVRNDNSNSTSSVEDKHRNNNANETSQATQRSISNGGTSIKEESGGSPSSAGRLISMSMKSSKVVALEPSEAAVGGNAGASNSAQVIPAA